MSGIIHTSGAVYPEVPIGSYKNNSERKRKKERKGERKKERKKEKGRERKRRRDDDLSLGDI